MSDNSTPDRAAADQVVGGSSGPGLTDAEVAERVEALPAEMTVAEKAGQLTQYFYSTCPSDEVEATLRTDFSRQPWMEGGVERGKGQLHWAFAPMVDIARDRGGGGSSRALVRTPTSGARSQSPRFVASGCGSRLAGPDHRRSEALRRVRRRLGRPRRRRFTIGS